MSYSTLRPPVTARGSAEVRQGVVQWVVPKRATPPNKEQGNKENIKTGRDKPPDYDSDEHHNSPNITTGNSFAIYHCEPDSCQNGCHFGPTDEKRTAFRDHKNQRNIQPTNANKSPRADKVLTINNTHCRTITLIVDQYTSELKEHQEQINSTRARLVRNVPQREKDGSFIAFNDLARLKVRGEQTKAIDTIKQLTNYLRELTAIKFQLDAATDPISEDIYNKLSDVRNNIIQTLNDFVLANSDIDFPIVDLEDPSTRDYDLCIDAQRSNKNISKIEISQSFENITTPTIQASNSSGNSRGDSQEDQLVSLMQSNNFEQRQQQIELLERRKRDLQKLEKATVQLRELFADFYNLIKVQGEQIDTIEDNVVKAAQHISEGRYHLQQRPLKGLTVLVPVTGCITGALIGGPIGFIMGSKIGGLTIICATSLLGLLSSLGAQKCITYGHRVKHGR